MQRITFSYLPRRDGAPAEPFEEDAIASSAEAAVYPLVQRFHPHIECTGRFGGEP